MVIVMPLRGITAWKSIPVTWEWVWIIFGIVGEPAGGALWVKYLRFFVMWLWVGFFYFCFFSFLVVC